MVVKFERRWDFIQAFLKGTLITDAPGSTSIGIDTTTMFPVKSSVFSQIRELHLNLCRGTDFDGRVTNSEAQRVTKAILHIIAQDMPALKALFFMVDGRSRLSNNVIAFLPDVWFMESLLAVKHVRTVSFAPGPGWQGHAQNKKNARACIWAMNMVLGAHFANRHPGLKLDYDGITGRALQARLGRRMLRYLDRFQHFTNARIALAMKVVMLESVA